MISNVKPHASQNIDWELIKDLPKAPRVEETQKTRGGKSVHSLEDAQRRQVLAYGHNHAADSLKVDGQTLEERAYEFMHQTMRRRNQEREPTMLDRWDDQWKLFLNIHELVRYCREFGTQLRMPVAFESIYTNLPRVYESMFPGIWKRIVARNPALEENARNMDAMVDWNFQSRKWAPTLMDAILLSGIHGFAAVRIDWHRQITNEIQLPVEPEEIEDLKSTKRRHRAKLERVTRERVVNEGVALKLLRPHDFYMPMEGTWDPDECEDGVQETSTVTLKQLRQGEAFGYYLPGTLNKVRRDLMKGETSAHNSSSGDAVNEWDIEAYKWPYETGRRIAAGMDDWQWSPRQDVRVHAEWRKHRHQGPFPLHGYDKEWVECDVEMIGPFLVRCVENPFGFRDYQLLHSHAIPGFPLSSQGLITPCDTLIRGINEFANLDVELRALQVRPPLVISSTAGMPAANKIRAEAGAVWQPRHPNLVQWLPPPSDAGGGQQAISFQTMSMQRALGQPAVMRGESAEGRQTGTEVSINREEASARIRMESLRGQETLQLPLVKKTGRWLQIKLSSQHWIRVLGEDGIRHPKKMSRADILGDFDYIAMGATQTANQSLHVQQMQNFLTLAQGMTQVDPSVAQQVDFMTLLEKIGTTLGIPGMDEIIRKPPEELPPNAPMQELLYVRDGGVIEPKPGPENVIYKRFYDSPMEDGMPLWAWFMENPDIDPAAQYNFAILYKQRSALADAFLREQQMAQMQQQLQAAVAAGGQPQQPGMTPTVPGAGASNNPHLAPPGAQENIRTPEGIQSQVRSDAQQRAGSLQAAQKHKGYR